MKSARLTIIMLGGAGWTPIAWRRIESTVTMNGKHVTMIASPGASDRRVIRTKIWIILSESEPPSPPRSMAIPCAVAGPASTRARIAAPVKSAVSLEVIREIGHLGQAHAESPGPVVDLLKLAPRDQPVADMELHRIVDLRSERPHRGAPPLGGFADERPRLAARNRHLDRHAHEGRATPCRGGCRSRWRFRSARRGRSSANSS